MFRIGQTPRSFFESPPAPYDHNDRKKDYKPTKVYAKKVSCQGNDSQTAYSNPPDYSDT
jgi:hypothetical protein